MCNGRHDVPWTTRIRIRIDSRIRVTVVERSASRNTWTFIIAGNAAVHWAVHFVAVISTPSPIWIVIWKSVCSKRNRQKVVEINMIFFAVDSIENLGLTILNKGFFLLIKCYCLIKQVNKCNTFIRLLKFNGLNIRFYFLNNSHIFINVWFWRVGIAVWLSYIIINTMHFSYLSL